MKWTTPLIGAFASSLAACSFWVSDPALRYSVSSMIPKQHHYGSAASFMDRGMSIKCEFIARGQHAVAVTYWELDEGRNWTTDNPDKVEVLVEPAAEPTRNRAVWPALNDKTAQVPLSRLKQTVRLRFKAVQPGDKISFRMGFRPISVETSRRGVSGPWKTKTLETPVAAWDSYVHTVEILSP